MESPSTLWFGLVPVLLFVLSLASLPFLVALIPRDYFLGPEPPVHPWFVNRPFALLCARILANALGCVLILLGLAMLVLPGQGLLTILLGLMLLKLPGKRRLELRLVRRPGILRSLNWIRGRLRREPLRIDRS